MAKPLNVVCRSAAAAICVVFGWGCAARYSLGNPGMVSQIHLAPRDVAVVQVAEGKSCVPVLLNFQIDNPSYLDAQQAAKAKAGAELLLDEVGYDGMEYALGLFLPVVTRSPSGGYGFGTVPFIIYGDRCEYVEGVGAKLNR